MAVEHAPTEPAQATPADTEPAAPAWLLSAAAGEQRRWIHFLGLELAAFCACLLALFATGIEWFIVPALLSAPIAGSLTLVYLAISSDANTLTGRAQSHESGDDGSHEQAQRWQPKTRRTTTERSAMSLRFSTNLLVLLAGGLVAVASQAFDAGTSGWIAFGIALGILAVTAASPGERANRAVQIGLDALTALLAVWTIIASVVFDGATLTWLSLGEALGFVVLAVGGLVAHELSTERTMHSLASVERGGESAAKGPYSAAA